MWRPLFPIAVAVTLWIPLASGPVRAQSEEELELARTQFAEAVEHAAEGNHREAATLFRSVLAVRSTPAVRYNLAHSLVGLHELAEADEQLQLVLEDEGTDDALRANAADLRLQMEAEGGRLAITVDGATEGVQVILDDREIAERFRQRPVRVRAGTHIVALERGGEELESRTIEVARGERVEASFTVAPAPEVVAETEVEEPQPVPIAEPVEVEEDEGVAWSDWRIWAVVGGVVLVGVAIGLAVGLSGGDDPQPFVGDFRPGTITWR